MSRAHPGFEHRNPKRYEQSPGVRPIDLLVRGWEPTGDGYWRNGGKEFPEHFALAIERNKWHGIVWGK